MATIRPCVPHQARLEFLQGLHGPADRYRLVLLGPVVHGDYGPDSLSYPGAGKLKDEVKTCDAYVEGGILLTGYAAGKDEHGAFIGFPPVVLKNCSITALGGLIINASKGNRIVSVADFGMAVSSTNADFEVDLPKAIRF